MAHDATNPPAVSVLQTVDQVAARLGLSRASIWRYTRADPSFPKPVKLSAGCARWHSSEIEAWLASRPRVEAA